MVAKDHILSEIRRTGEENGGKPLGRERFVAETGIGEHDYLRYWARWGDALTEAGFEPNAFNPRINDADVIERLAIETRHFGRFPTVAELRLRRREDPTMPSEGVFQRLGAKPTRARLVAEYCEGRPDFADVLAIVSPWRDGVSDGSRESPPTTVEYGSVYLLKSGRHYKLGRTNSFGRREYEIGLQLPERASAVHVIKTEDPPGIEDYWHRRFADRRRNGEWFDLSRDDVRAFKRHKVM